MSRAQSGTWQAWCWKSGYWHNLPDRPERCQPQDEAHKDSWWYPVSWPQSKHEHVMPIHLILSKITQDLEYHYLLIHSKHRRAKIDRLSAIKNDPSGAQKNQSLRCHTALNP